MCGDHSGHDNAFIVCCLEMFGNILSEENLEEMFVNLKKFMAVSVCTKIKTIMITIFKYKIL